jgi:hypothetical protein
MKIERDRAEMNLMLWTKKERKSKFFELGLMSITAIALPVLVVAGLYGYASISTAFLSCVSVSLSRFRICYHRQIPNKPHYP